MQDKYHRYWDGPLWTQFFDSLINSTPDFSLLDLKEKIEASLSAQNFSKGKQIKQKMVKQNIMMFDSSTQL